MNWSEQLKAYLDNELAPEQREQVERALAESPELRQELEQLRSISESLRTYAGEIQPTGYEALAGRLGTAPARPWWLRPLPAAAVLVAVVAIGAVATREMAADRDQEDRVAMSGAQPEMTAAPASVGADSAELGGPARGYATAQAVQRSFMLVVEDVDKAELAVEKLAADLKGTVQEREPNGKSAMVSLFVPSESVGEVTEKLAKLGSLRRKSDAQMNPELDSADTLAQLLQRQKAEAEKRFEQTGSTEAEMRLKELNQKLKVAKENEKKLAEGKLVELKLTINARSSGVP